MQTGILTDTTTSATAAATSNTTGTNAHNTIDKDGFLKLLVVQLQNQDPTATSQDPNQMVQQMTSFSSLEQQQQTNTLLQGLQTQNTSLFQAQAVGMVGKTVRIAGDGVSLKGGQATMGLDLTASAQVTLTIKDAHGNAVRTLNEGQLSSGSNTLTWDGKDSNGVPLPDGNYSVEVQAQDGFGKAVDATPSMYLKVDAVSFQNGSVQLTAGGSTFSLSDVLEIKA